MPATGSVYITEPVGPTIDEIVSDGSPLPPPISSTFWPVPINASSTRPDFKGAKISNPTNGLMGASFRVRLPDSRLETFRLYFVDTTESRSHGERSDEQAAYFGLTRAQAIDLGGQAKKFTASALAQPFT